LYAFVCRNGQARLALPTHPGAPETTSWCLILEDTPPSKRAQSPSLPSLPPLGPPPGLRWAAEETIQSWVEEGSTIVGEWPETLQDAFGRQLAQSRYQLEEERNAVQTSLADLTANFNAYKQRAQSALKVCNRGACLFLFISRSPPARSLALS